MKPFPLAIASDCPGNGHLRDFIAQAKTHYPTIVFWLVAEPILIAALKRYDFRYSIEIKPDGFNCPILRWDKP